ncbi:hypothetical protein PR048_022015, partial [Dryococelus australis]
MVYSQVVMRFRKHVGDSVLHISFMVMNSDRIKGWGNERSSSEPADQRYRPARFPHGKIRSDPAGDWWEASRLTAQPPWLLVTWISQTSSVSEVCSSSRLQKQVRRAIVGNQDTATRIMSPIVAKRKALNWRAVFSSCCVYLLDFQRSTVVGRAQLSYEQLRPQSRVFARRRASAKACIIRAEVFLCRHSNEFFDTRNNRAGEGRPRAQTTRSEFRGLKSVCG